MSRQTACDCNIEREASFTFDIEYRISNVESETSFMFNIERETSFTFDIEYRTSNFEREANLTTVISCYCEWHREWPGINSEFHLTSNVRHHFQYQSK
jgi:hypothetical protein